MSSDQIVTTSTSTTAQPDQEHEDDEQIMSIRDIHALTPPHPPPPLPRRREAWETSSHQSSMSMASNEGSENFTTISREFNALVLAGSAVENNRSESDHGGGNNGNYNLGMIGEEDETNPLAIVPDTNPMASPRRQSGSGSAIAGASSSMSNSHSEVSVQRVKKEEVETKISAWQNAKIAKINNRFKREDAIINGWENEQIQKSTSWMKKIEVLVFGNLAHKFYPDCIVCFG